MTIDQPRGAVAPNLSLTYAGAQGTAATVLRCDGTIRATATFDGTPANSFPVSAFTLCVWLRNTQLDAGAELFRYGPDTSATATRLWISNPGNLSVQLGTASTGATGLAWNDGHWHHLALVFTLADPVHYALSIYKDAVQSWQSERGLPFAAGQGLAVAGLLALGGGGAQAPAVGYVGEMSEFQLWAGALDGFALATLLQRRSTATQAGLVVRWPLDQNPPGNSIPPSAFVSSTLRFREPDSGRPDFVMAGWDAVPDAISYDLQVVAETGDWTFSRSAITPADVPVPVPGVLLGRRYRARARTIDASGTGPWSTPVELAPLDLQPVDLGFTWPENGTLDAVWPPVDQAQQYDIALYQGLNVQPTTRVEQPGTTYSLATLVDTPDAWRIAVRGVSVLSPWLFGSSGPPNDVGPIDKTLLGFYYLHPEQPGNGAFEFVWPTPLTGATYLLLEVVQSGTSIIRQWIAGTQPPPFTIPSPVPVSTGEQYTGRLRRIGAGVLSVWDDKTITIHAIAQPVLQYQATIPPAAERLDLIWAIVSPTATYDLTILTDGGNPQRHTQVSSPYDITNLLANNESPADNHFYTFEVQAVEDGEIGPPNTIVQPPAVTIVFTYVYAGGTDPGILQAVWIPASGLGIEIYVRIFPDTATTPSQYAKLPIEQGTYDVPVPTGGFVDGTIYRLQLRAMAEGSLARAQFGQVTIRKLATPAVTIGQTTPPELAIQAQWPAIDPNPAVAYLVRLNGTIASPPQTGLTFDLSSHLDDAAAVAIDVRGTQDQSYGPWSAIGTPPLLQPDTRFVSASATTGTLTVGWQAAPWVYVNALHTGETGPVVQQIITDGTTHSVIVPPPTGGFVEGDTYSGRVKSTAAGMLGAFETDGVVIHWLAQPVPQFPTTNTATSVLLTWDDIRTAAQRTAGVQVSYQVAIDGVSVGPPQSALSYDLTSRVTQDAAIAVTIQGTADHSYGLISQPPAVATPVIGHFTYDASDTTIAIDWPAAAGAVAYYVEVRDSGDNSLVASRWVNAQGESTIGVIFTQTLQAGHTYVAKVRGLAGGTMSAFGTMSLATYSLVGPSGLTLTPTFTDHAIAASWQFDTQGLPAIVYVAELRDANDAVLDRQSATAKTTVLHYPSTVPAGATLSVRVRATAGSDAGLWSQPQTITVGSDLAQVQITSATADTLNTITVTWNAVSGTNVRYELQMNGPGLNQPFTRDNLTATRVDLSQSDTQVQEHSTYAIQVRASQPTPPGPWSDPRNVTTNTLQSPDDGQAPNSGTEGDPVTLATGWYSYSNIDIEVVGAAMLQFVTFYNTFTNLPTEDPPRPDRPLGGRWNHIYNTGLQTSIDGKTLAVVWGAGVISKYNVPASVTGTFTKQGLPSGDTLVRLADLTYQLTTWDQTIYRFDASGVLQQIVNAAGNAVLLTYQDGKLAQITDRGSGRTLTLSYYGAGENAGRINTVTDQAGRSISYVYEQGNLKTYTDVQGHSRIFAYDAPSMMKTATDQDGNVFITNTYDSERRVVTQKDARATANHENYLTTFGYEEFTQDGYEYLRTTVTDRMGFVAVYVSNSVTRNTISEVHNLASGDVWRVLRTFDGSGALLTETVYQGPSSGASDVGNTTRYTYDGRGNLLTSLNPLGQQQVFTYDDRNNLTSSIDLLGNTTRIDYVPGTNLVQTITSPCGQQQVFTYRSVGNGITGLPDTVTLYPEGQSVSTHGNVTTLSYYDTGELKQRKAPLGETTDYGYDTRNTGWLTSITIKDAAGVVVQQVAIDPWPASGLPHTRALQFPGQPIGDRYVTTYEYDNLGFLTGLTNPLNHRTQFDYDPNSLLQRTTYPTDHGNPQSTVYGYDRDDRPSSTTYSPSDPTVITRTTYDEVGRLTQLTDANNQVTTRTYTMALQPAGTPCPMVETTTFPPVEIHYPDGRTETVTYARTRTFDAAGRLIAETDLAPVGTTGAATTYAYTVVPDPGGNRLKIVTTLPKTDPNQPQPFQTITILNTSGRVLSFTNERAQTWSSVRGFAWDPDTSTVRTIDTMTDPLTNQTVMIGDAANRLIVRKIGQGSQWRQTSVAYDPLNRPIRVEEPDPDTAGATVSSTIAYEYDPATTWMVTRITPYQQPSSRYLYDGAGQFVRGIDAHGNTVQLDYTAGGQLQTYRNGRQQRQTYGYDNAGRFITTELSDRVPAVTIAQLLDGNGNRLQTTVAGVPALVRTFDAFNRLTSRTLSASSQAVAYTYDAMSLVKTITWTGLTGALQFDYDGLGRMSTVTDWRQRVSHYTYYPTGQLQTAALPGQVSIAYTFDEANRLTGLRSTVGTEIVADTVLVLDAFGQPSRADRIMPLRPTVTAGTQQFTYVDADRLDTVNGVSVTYDGDGNITGTPGFTGTLAYDENNLLTAIGTNRSYVYDPDGLPVSATIDGAATKYLQDVASYQNPLIEQADPTVAIQGALPRTWLDGPVGLVPASASDSDPMSTVGGPLNRLLATFDDSGASVRYAWGQGLIGRDAADGSYQTYLFDEVGNTIALVNEQGLITDRFAYTPYNAPAGRTGTTPTPFLVHGRYGVLSDEAGAVFMRARVYAPGVLRFLERDALIGDLFVPQTLNRYAFVTGNPIGLIDPLGLSGNKDSCGFWCWTGRVAAGVGIALAGVAVVGAGVVAGLALAPATSTAFTAGLSSAVAADSAVLAGSFAQRLAFVTGRAAGRLVGRNLAWRWAASRGAAGYGPVSEVELQTFSNVAPRVGNTSASVVRTPPPRTGSDVTGLFKRRPSVDTATDLFEDL
jgi:RHS repeat-associated protein